MYFVVRMGIFSSLASAIVSVEGFFTTDQNNGRNVQNICGSNHLCVGQSGEQQAAGFGKRQHIAHQVSAKGGFHFQIQIFFADNDFGIQDIFYIAQFQRLLLIDQQNGYTTIVDTKLTTYYSFRNWSMSSMAGEFLSIR